MGDGSIDILMITYNRPEYTRLALERLFATCDASARVWIWHNGNHAETLEVASAYKDHPRLYRFHHSRENMRLRAPTNWLLTEGEGEFVTKVDDDCLMPEGWIQTLRGAHRDEPRFGALGCWRFLPEDFLPEAAKKKIRDFRGGHWVMCHPWVEGSGFMLKRACIDRLRVLRKNESGMTGLLTRIARRGWVNGWYYPFLWQEHMDDPRAPHSLLRTDEDLQKHLPLSAKNFGSSTLEQWDQQLRRSAALLQNLPSDPHYYHPLRIKFRRNRDRILRLLSSQRRSAAS